MIRPCETCGGNQADGSTFCVGCAHRLDAHIADVSAYHGLAYDLDIAITRQSKIGARDGSRPTEAAVAYDGRASKAAAELKTVLASWARLIAEETGAEPPTATVNGDVPLARLAAWLRPRVGWLRHHQAGAEAYDQIIGAVQAARRVVDRPAERLYAGPCDCGADLYARLDASYVVCRGGDHEEPVAWPVEKRRRWLLQSAEDVLATTTEISRALTRYAQPVTPSAIRGYVARGRLAPHGERVENGRPVPLYRLGDVLEIVAPEPRGGECVTWESY